MEYSYSNFAINQLIWYISSITNFVHFIDPQNFVLGLQSSCRRQISNFIKKRLQHRLFHVKFAKFLRAPCFTEHLQWLLLKVSGFQPATLLKKRLRNGCFAINLDRFWRTSFLLTEHLRMTASCDYLWILGRFSEHFFYRVPWGNGYFMYMLHNFNHRIQ